MIRDEKPIAIVFNKLACPKGGTHVYKAFNTQNADFINLISKAPDLESGTIIALEECMTRGEEKVPVFKAGETLSMEDFSEAEQSYIRDTITLHDQKMRFLADAAGANGHWGRMRAYFAGKETRQASTSCFRPKPQG